MNEQVAEWIAGDPDAAARAELQGLLDAGDEAALADRFAGPLTFGTAGLRGPMRAGPNGMNVAVVRRAAAGLAAFLRQSGPAPHVVIGYDARHHSHEFAADSARVMAAAGLRVELLGEALPTPVLAYAARARSADAGVMVTASHNRAQDNGYKVYLAGAQIVPPQDALIEAAIASAPAASQVQLSDAYVTLGPEILRQYLDAVTSLSLVADRSVRIAYTPLHGVGGAVMRKAFAQAGFAVPDVVPQQAEPDPDFPTVTFPNPEEPGATDLLLALAARAGADIAIANDPDADRCSVATGGRLLTGDEVGLLLADHILTRRPRQGRPLVATTIVSSSALHALAAARDADATTTLTGFKWLARAGGPELVFAYEEALGYAVGLDVVRDKDGISAALAIAELAAALKRSGRTLRDRLDEIACEIGLFATKQLSVRHTDPRAGARVVEWLLSSTPPELGGTRVHSAHDLSHPRDGLPPTEGVRLQLAGGRIVIRPSGTEPKLKAYLEVVTPAEIVSRDVAAARRGAADQLARLSGELLPLLS
ncbi:MAG TPA: phospho-sugar mutase [Frankiaceae bacterium]|nr:phospho-sugar mutase [Frankiaceae bacterium]